MSAKRTYTLWLSASACLFLVMLLLFDHDLFRYPVLRTAGGTEREQRVVLAALGRYNSILSDIYASGGKPALLDEFPATKAMRHGVFRDIGFLRESGRVLVYDLAEMTPVSVLLLSPRDAEAVVFEEWNYLYQRADDRIPISKIRGMGQGFRYRLVRQNERWMVAQCDPADVEEPEQKGFVY